MLTVYKYFKSVNSKAGEELFKVVNEGITRSHGT